MAGVGGWVCGRCAVCGWRACRYFGRALLACISRCPCPACRSSARGHDGAAGRGVDDGKDDRARILVGQPSVLGEHSVKRVIFILACAVAAFHGLGAQQTVDDARAREAAAVQLTATRHAPLPPNVSQYWFCLLYTSPSPRDS